MASEPTLDLLNRSPSRESDSSSSSSPERNIDDDNDFFDAGNDSESSIGLANPREVRSMVKTEEEHRASPISRLPPEIFLTIIAKLSNSPKDLRSCMLVSLYWATHTVQTLWHRPACNKWENFTTIAKSLHSGGFFPYHEYIRRLNLSALNTQVSNGSVRPFEDCKRIERLTLTNCARLNDQAVISLVEGNRHLQAIDVTDLRELTDQTLFIVANNAPRLQGLNITNCRRVTDDSLVAVSEACRQLKRLKLNNCESATDTSILSFADHCQMILEIDLHACRQVSSVSVTALLSQLPSLRELRLAHCSEVGDTAFLDLPQRMFFDSLRILDLTACEQVGDLAIQRIIPATPRLRNLVLAKCRHITDQSIKAIATLGKNLHYIHLGHCTNLTDQGVMELVKACNRIRYIDLACCNRLTDRSVQDLAQLPKLRRIGLVKCQNLTDRSIFALAKGASASVKRELSFPHGSNHVPGRGYPGTVREGPSLERVHLSYCIHLTLQGVHALLQTCPKLTHLSLTGVAAFLNPDLTQFCRDAPPEFTDQQRSVFCVFSGSGVSELREHLNHLMNVNAARYANRRAGGNVSDSDYGDDITENGDGSGNEDGVADLDGGAPLPGQHTMYHHDADDDDATGEEGDDEEDPLPPDYRQPRRRRNSHSDAARVRSTTAQRFGIEGMAQDNHGPSSLPASDYVHYLPHPTVPSQFQFTSQSINPGSYVPSQSYLQNANPHIAPLRSEANTAMLEQAILSQNPHFHLPRDRQIDQHLMLARHYDDGTGFAGSPLQQPPPPPVTPLQQQSRPQSFFGPQHSFSPTLHDSTSSNRQFQARPERPTQFHQHRSSSETLSFQMQQMPRFTTPSTTPQGQPPQSSSSPWLPVSNTPPGLSPRMMPVQHGQYAQDYPPMPRPIAARAGPNLFGSAPAVPNMMGGRSMSNPQSGSSANLNIHHNFNFHQTGPPFPQTPLWRTDRGPPGGSNSGGGNADRVAQLRGGGGGGDSNDNASDLDIDIDLGSDADEGTPVHVQGEQNNSTQQVNNGGRGGGGAPHGGRMMMV